jgi:ABC-type phosphate transport system ATPase subunit
VDREHVAVIERLISRFAEERTVILTTHNLEQADRPTRVQLLLEDGRIACVRRP